jgi:hypothetical protein
MAKSLNLPINNPDHYQQLRDASRSWQIRHNPVANPDRALSPWALTVLLEAATKELNK